MKSMTLDELNDEWLACGRYINDPFGVGVLIECAIKRQVEVEAERD